MKNLILIFTLIVYSVTLNAQDYAVAVNTNSRINHKDVKKTELILFTSDVISNEEFRYRDFLKKSKNSKANFQLDGKTLTKMELTKLFRKAAVVSRNYGEFKIIINNKYPQFLNVISDKEMNLLYEKFRKGTLNLYLQELSENW